MGRLKLAAAAAPNAQVVVPFLRRSERLAAEPSGAQIPSPRQAKQSPLPRLPGSQIQSRGSIQRQSSAAPLKRNNAPYYWGATRRARSALAGSGGCSNPGARSPSRRGEKRKLFCASSYSPAWGANLGDGPAGLIADFALANDVADYVRFRAVCRPWRRCAPDPRAGGLDGRFLPRRWIMLDKAIAASPRCHRFLNISTGECIRMSLLPELDEHRFLAVTPEGLLLLLHVPTLVIRLLNPLTRKLTDFPPMTALLPPEMVHFGGVHLMRVTGVGLVVDRSMLVVGFDSPMVLVVAKPGDESWTVVIDGYIDSTLTFAGQFYCTNGMGVMVLDMNQHPPQLRVVIEPSGSLIRFSAMKHSLHLVDNGGELMPVHRMLCVNTGYSSYTMKYEVYRVDLNAGILIPIKSLNGRAVFMGMCRAISISADIFPFVTADTLFLGLDCDEKRRMDGYNIADGNNVHCYYNRRVRPFTLVDCLSSCIRGCFPEN